MKHLKNTQIKTDKLGENEQLDTIPEKEIENLQLLLSEKETTIEKPDERAKQ